MLIKIVIYISYSYNKWYSFQKNLYLAIENIDHFLHNFGTQQPPKVGLLTIASIFQYVQTNFHCLKDISLSETENTTYFVKPCKMIKFAQKWDQLCVITWIQDFSYIIHDT